MSYLCTIIEFIQNLCQENEQINSMLKEIDDMNRENIQLQNQLSELDREHIRLKIELHNLETITSFNDVSAVKNLNQTAKHLYKDCVELKSLIDKIDFTKILQCYHMEMEVKCRKEWQPIQDCFVKTLNWHEQMEQRQIVKKFRQAEILYREAEDANKTQQNLMEKSLKQSLELISQAKGKRNNLIVALIKGSKDLYDLNTKMEKLNQYQVYIVSLRQEQSKIRDQLEQNHLKAFNPILNSKNIHSFGIKTKANVETSNLIMPKLPSFADILKSFNQTENLISVISIENSTSFCVKSILHTSNASAITKQTKNVHFKAQLEEYRETTEIETETENDVEVIPSQTVMEIYDDHENKENLQDMRDFGNGSDIETIDLLTQTDESTETVKENKESMHSLSHNSPSEENAHKTTVEIQDCVIFKTPFPLQELTYRKDKEHDKENIPRNINSSHSTQHSETYSSNSSHTDIKEILNTTKKSFYDDFLSDSASAEVSTKIKMLNNESNNGTSFVKDFETFFDENKDFLLASKNPNGDKRVNESGNNFPNNNSPETQDFLDFNSSTCFAFDSDDNMTNNYNTGNMDFM